jgi:predicted LPLAT superfamily acyltransferase
MSGREVSVRRPPKGDNEPGADWLNQAERGQLWLIQISFRVAVLLGRRFMGPVVSLVALWYRVVDRSAVASSRDWLTRIHGRSPGFWEIYRHLRTFAQTTLDKVFFLTGRTEQLIVTNHGGHLLEAQVASGKGALLLGSHLGSYDAMRSVGMEMGLPVQVVGYFENASMINSLLKRLNPGLAEQVIHLGDDPVGVMVRLQGQLQKGGLVAVAGDRIGLNERVVMANFMGQPAPFAGGPFLLASVMRCPVFLVCGIYTGPNRYDLICERFADRIDLPRPDRERALAVFVQAYADRLESLARQKPNNWFNFFDFWSRP